jgi:hypothetical protein
MGVGVLHGVVSHFPLYAPLYERETLKSSWSFRYLTGSTTARADFPTTISEVVGVAYRTLG